MSPSPLLLEVPQCVPYLGILSTQNVIRGPASLGRIVRNADSQELCIRICLLRRVPGDSYTSDGLRNTYSRHVLRL